eukprot:scaffold4568_cov74-Cyclotella_meneghiniana.AAC.19
MVGCDGGDKSSFQSIARRESLGCKLMRWPIFKRVLLRLTGICNFKFQLKLSAFGLLNDGRGSSSIWTMSIVDNCSDSIITHTDPEDRKRTN